MLQLTLNNHLEWQGGELTRAFFAFVVATVCSLSFGAERVDAQEFRGAHELVREMDTDDTYTLGFILQRCAGLWYAIGSYSEMLPQDEANMIAVDFATASMEIFRKREPNRSIESITAEALEENVAVAKVYIEIMTNNQRMTGSMFDDWLKRELDFCKELSGAFSE